MVNCVRGPPNRISGYIVLSLNGLYYHLCHSINNDNNDFNIIEKNIANVFRYVKGNKIKIVNDKDIQNFLLSIIKGTTEDYENMYKEPYYSVIQVHNEPKEIGHKIDFIYIIDFQMNTLETHKKGQTFEGRLKLISN